MRQFSIFQAFLFSFFSPTFYRDVARNWRGVCFLFLLMLLALTWLVPITQFHRQFANEITTNAPKIIEQVPNISINSGELAIDQPVPYFINDPNTDSPFVIIDTSGQYTTLDGTNARMLVTKNRVIVERNEFETRSFDLSQFNNVAFGKTELYRWVDIFGTMAAPIAYPFAVLGSFIYRIFQVLLYALFGMIFVGITNAKLNYQALVRLAVMAVTPVILLDTFRSLFSITIVGWSFLCLIIALIYLFIGVRANAVVDEPLITS